jgi:hypothetical protein
LFTYWAGLGFTNAWFLVKRSMSTEVFTPAMQAATAVLIIIAFLFLLDGPTAFFDDPGYVGLCVAPGLELILPWLHGRTRTPQVDEDPPSLADG